MAVLDSDLESRFPSLDADALKEITETDLTDDALNNFLNIAFYMTRPLAGELGACGGINAEEMIVKFMAAHLLTAFEQQPVYESVNEWSARYRGADGEGIKSSTYGQQALAIDCSGILAGKAMGLRDATLRTITYYDINDENESEPII